MKENIKMKKEQLSITEKDYAQLMAEYKATDKENKKPWTKIKNRKPSG